MNTDMKLDPVFVFNMDWSRKFLKVCANGASGEPIAADETGQFTGRVGIVVIDV